MQLDRTDAKILRALQEDARRSFRELAQHVAAKRFKEAPRVILSGPLSTTVACLECGQAIDGEPIKLRLEGRIHYVCCPSCEQLYKERYFRIKAAAQAG